MLIRLLNLSRAARRPAGAARASRRAGAAAVCVLCATLGACGIAPGMRMSVSARSGQNVLVNAEPSVAGGVREDGTELLPADAQGNAQVTARMNARMNAQAATRAPTKANATPATPEIPITELNVALVKLLQEQQQRAQAQQTKLLSGTPQPYTVGPGDVLQIVVWDHPEIAQAMGTAQSQSSSRPGDPPSGFVVDQAGDLTFPYAGTLNVAGLRPEEVQKRLGAQLARYFVKPQVTVRMASYRAHDVYVDGEVRNPGVIAVNDVPMSAYEAIARAGGFSETADQSDLVLVRDGVTHRVNFTRMLASGLSPSRLYLKPGDMLRVVARDENDVYVMGEVNRPMSAVPRRTGRITLADALLQAGSVNASTADAAQMFVIRGALNGTPQVFHLDGRSPVAMLVAKEFDLQPKDVVYVDGNGLVRFNRVLTLLLPAINAGLAAGLVAK